MLARIRAIFMPPVFEDKDKTRTARLLNAVLLTLFVSMTLVTGILLVTRGFPNDRQTAFVPLSSVIMAVAMEVLLAYVRRGYLRWPSIILLSLLWAITTFWIYSFVDSIGNDQSILIYVLVIVLSGLLLGERGAIVYTLLAIVAVLGVFYAEMQGITGNPDHPPTYTDLLFILVPMIMTGLLLSYAVRNMNQALNRLAESNRELQVARTSLEQRNEHLRNAVREYVAYMVEVTQGNLSVRLVLDEDDEKQGDPLIVLGQHLNEMTSSLQHTIDQERAHRKVIESQQQAIRELSTPIIPVMDVPKVGSIIVLPLIGIIDTARARDITRQLLAGIREHRAKVVILDITGVPLVDSSVADYLHKTVQAARLKGARVIVTGISDVVAETIVDLGIDWFESEHDGVRTLSNLQMGLVVALHSLGFRLESSRR